MSEGTPVVTCVDCNQKINSSVYVLFRRDSKTLIWKACPKCSKINGTRHEFKLLMEYSDETDWVRHTTDFGFSTLRENPRNPLGVQSLCKVCRGNRTLRGLTREQLVGDVVAFGSWSEIESFI